jgi:hypothetical protein
MIKNTHGLYAAKSIELGQVIIQSEHSRLKVFFDYDFDVIDQSVKFFVNVKEIHILINDDYSIFIELSKFDECFLKSLALVIIEHMEQ